MTFKKELGQKLAKAVADVANWSLWEREVTKHELGETLPSRRSDINNKARTIAEPTMPPCPATNTFPLSRIFEIMYITP